MNLLKLLVPKGKHEIKKEDLLIFLKQTKFRSLTLQIGNDQKTITLEMKA